MKAFAVTLLGGMGNIQGAIIVGLSWNFGDARLGLYFVTHEGWSCLCVYDSHTDLLSRWDRTLFAAVTTESDPPMTRRDFTLLVGFACLILVILLLSEMNTFFICSSLQPCSPTWQATGTFLTAIWIDQLRLRSLCWIGAYTSALLAMHFSLPIPSAW